MLFKDKVQKNIEQLYFEEVGKTLADFKSAKITKVSAQHYQAMLPFPFDENTLAHRLSAQLDADIRVEFLKNIPAFAVQPSLKPLPEIKNIIAIASGKGGVGKSTVAFGLALALRAQGATVGLLDADIYGPSQPLLLGGAERPKTRDKKTMEPVEKYGLQTMSMGYLLEGEDQPVIWRGPMVSTALKQLLQDTQWSNLDYLIVDLPPGTGDIQLTLVQKIPLAGALIVTTPQDLSLIDARKALRMFNKVNVPVLGIIENMSHHVCEHCGHESAIFGAGGGAMMSAHYEVPLLGQIPLAIELRTALEKGQPAAVLQTIAAKCAMQLALRPKSYAHKFNVKVEEGNIT